MAKRITPGGPFIREAIGESPPTGVIGHAEYQWGTHAQATHGAEGIKSVIFRSVVAAIAVSAAVPAFIFAPQQAYADVNQSFISEPLTGSPPRPIQRFSGAPQLVDLTLQGSVFGPASTTQGRTVKPLLVGGPLQVDLTQQGLVFEPTPARQGAVPPLFVGDPQDDPSQLQARVTPSQPAAAIIPNPIAGFFSVPPQNEERPTRVVWQSQRAGARPTAAPFVFASPQTDPTQLQPLLVPARPAAIIVANPIAGFFSAAPQLVDLTLQGWVRGTAPVRQAKVPATIWATQADPSQIAARTFRSTPQAVGRVPPLVKAGQPQFNPYQIPAYLCKPLVPLGAGGPASVLRGYVIQQQERALALELQERIVEVEAQDRVLAIEAQERVIEIASQDRVLIIQPQEREEDL